MTIGFAATYLDTERASLLLAADCRYSFGADATDTGIKTYALGQKSGAVVAGNALSVASAIEMTRGIVEDHNRLTPDRPINFYSVVRLFSFFLDQVERSSPWSTGSEVVLTGFLESGMPALAKVQTRPQQRAEAYVYAHRHPGSLIMLVGQQDGKENILAALAQSMQDGAPHWIERSVGTVAYLCGHQGERTIGGAPSVAVCPRDGCCFWPFVVFNDYTYLRGFDVTAAVPPTAPVPGDQRLYLNYDETWHANVDRSRPPLNTRVDDGFVAKAWYVDDWTPPDRAFQWPIEPPELTAPPDMHGPSHVIAIARPGEVNLGFE